MFNKSLCTLKITTKINRFIKNNKVLLFKNLITKYKYKEDLFNNENIDLLIVFKRYKFIKLIYKIYGNLKIESKAINYILNRDEHKKVKFLYYVCYLNEIDLLSFLIENYKYTKKEIQTTLFLSCYKYNLDIAKLLYKIFTPILIKDDLNILIYNTYYDNKLDIFIWLIHNYNYNLYSIKIENDFFTNKNPIDIFWYSCMENNINYSKIIYSNYIKYNQNINIFKNQNHRIYFNNLLEHNNCDIDLLKWLFLISNFNIEYKQYLIDLIEYLCEINNIEFLKWIIQNVAKLYKHDKILLSEYLLIDSVKLNHYEIFKFILDNELIRMFDNLNFIKILKKCVYKSLKYGNIKFIKYLDGYNNKLKTLIPYFNFKDNNKDNTEIDLDSDEEDDNFYNLFLFCHKKIVKLINYNVKLIVNNQDKQTKSYKNEYNLYNINNLIIILDILFNCNDSFKFIDNDDKLFKYFCKLENIKLINWICKKFHFYRAFKVLRSKKDENQFKYMECINYHDYDYLILHKKYKELSITLNISYEDNYDFLFLNKNIPKVDFSKKCNICFERKVNSISHCNHLFCLECILNWLEKKHECPYCRKLLDYTGLTIIDF